MRVRGAAPRRWRGRGAGSAAPVAGGRPPREQPPRAAGRLRCAPQTPRSRCAAAHGAAAPRRSALSTGPWRLRRRAQTRSDFATCSAPGAPCAGAGYGTSRGAAELGGQAAAELTWGRAWRRFARSRPLWGRAAGTSAALSSSTSARRAPPGAPRPRAPLPLNPNLTPWRAPRSHALVLDPRPRLLASQPRDAPPHLPQGARARRCPRAATPISCFFVGSHRVRIHAE